MTTEFITYNFPSCVCENLILLIVVLERLFWPIVFFAFIGLSISPPENEVNVTNLVIKCDWSEINKDDDNESSESDGNSESSHSEYVDETDESELSIWEDEDEDDVNDSDYVEETQEESDSDDSNDSGYDDEEETIVITPKIKLYRPNYCLRSSKSLIIV